MQERVLGTIIIGGIACIGVVWSLVDGIPALNKAKKQEKELENKIVEIVNENYGKSYSELDVKRVSYKTEIEYVKSKFSQKAVYYALVSMEGYTENNENFKFEILANTDYILTLNQQVGNSSLSANEALRYDIYQNYTMTSASTLLSIINDESSTVRGFYLGKGTYTRVYADEGAKIVNYGDPYKTNGKVNNPYTAKDVSEITSTLASQIYCYGSVDNLEKVHVAATETVSAYDAFNFDLVYESDDVKYSVAVENIVLGTGISSISNGDTVVLKTGVTVTDGKPVIKEYASAGTTIGSIVYSIGEPSTIGQLVITTDEADAVVKDFTYGERTDSQYYVTGEVVSVETDIDAQNNTLYNIRLKTSNTDANYYLEVYNASFDKANVSESEITVGDTISVKGLLTTSMYYEALAKVEAN